jgi:hypothetical protein
MVEIASDLAVLTQPLPRPRSGASTAPAHLRFFAYFAFCLGPMRNEPRPFIVGEANRKTQSTQRNAKVVSDLVESRAWVRALLGFVASRLETADPFLNGTVY